MSKSNARKVIVERVEKYAEHLERNPKSGTVVRRRSFLNTPRDSLVTVDGSYFLIRFLQGACTADSEEINLDDFLNNGGRVPGTTGGSSSAQNSKPSSKLKELEMGESRSSATYKTLGQFFVRLLSGYIKSMITPPEESSGIPRFNSNPPIIAPTLVVGFDKFSTQIKDATSAQRQEASRKSLIRRNEKDVAGGYRPERGLPINISRLLKDKNMSSEPLPYPPEKVISDSNEKNKMIAFVSKYILDSMMDGSMYRLVFGSSSPKVTRLSDMFCLVIDGHRLDPYDSDWLFYAYTNYKIEVCRPDWYKDFKSNFSSGPRSTFWTNDERERHYEIPGDYKHAYGTYNPLFLTPLTMYMCSVSGEEPLEHNPINSFPIRDPSKKEVNGFVILNDYMSRDVLTNLKESRSFKMIPESFCRFPINEIGEFDFTMFSYLDRMSKTISETRLSQMFDLSRCDCRILDSSPDEPVEMGAHFVTEDTDAFVMSLLATEVYLAWRRVKLFLKISGSPKPVQTVRNIPQTSPFRTVDKSNKVTYDIRTIANTLASMFPDTDFPSSVVSVLLYAKINDYRPTAFKGVSVETMFDRFAKHYDTIGHDLLVSTKDTQGWLRIGAAESKADREISKRLIKVPLLLDPVVFENFVTSLTTPQKFKNIPMSKTESNPYSYYVHRTDLTSGKKRETQSVQYTKKQIRDEWLRNVFIWSLYTDSVIGRYSNLAIPMEDAHLFKIV